MQESRPDCMTPLTAGRKGSPPACLYWGKTWYCATSLFSLSQGRRCFPSGHRSSLSFAWPMADISNQTYAFFPLNSTHLTPHLPRLHGSTGQMLEERTGLWYTISLQAKQGICPSPITAHGRHCYPMMVRHLPPHHCP